jgi:integrase
LAAPHLGSRNGAAIAKHNEEAKGKKRIPSGASAYSFRHARISELLQIYGVDPLTVAVQTGTSLVMIEKAYLRFIPSVLQEKLAAIKSS